MRVNCLSHKVMRVRVRWFLPFCLFTFLPLSAQRLADVAEHSKYIQAVDEYRPAPGQFVNDAPGYEEGDTEADMLRKCNENVAGLGPLDAHLVALGGWGGYITFHFDHSIANIPGQRDFAVWGNAYQEMKNLVFGGMNEAGRCRWYPATPSRCQPRSYHQTPGFSSPDRRCPIRRSLAGQGD